jgi:hypothetical protein
LVAAFLLISPFSAYGETLEYWEGKTVKTSGYYTYVDTPDYGRIVDVDPSIEGHVKIPSVIDGTIIRSIESQAFADCTRIVSVVVPDSVLSIEDGAFKNCTSLVSADVGDWTLGLGSEAFSGCTSLENVEFNVRISGLGGRTFENCTSLTSIRLPRNVSHIGDEAFKNCINLKSVFIPWSVSKIDPTAFTGCTSLANIEISPSNTDFSMQNGVIFNSDKTMLIYYPENKKDTSYTIPDGVKSIGEDAFYNNQYLESVVFPDSLEEFLPSSFENCGKLSEITMPERVRQICNEAFKNCTSLKTVNLSGYLGAWNTCVFHGCTALETINTPSDGRFKSIDGAIFDETKTKLFFYPRKGAATSYTVPEGTLYIKEDAFADCENLKEITLADSLKEIAVDAFDRCKNLQKIYYNSNKCEAVWCIAELEMHLFNTKIEFIDTSDEASRLEEDESNSDNQPKDTFDFLQTAIFIVIASLIVLGTVFVLFKIKAKSKS